MSPSAASATAPPPHDPVGAFCRDNHVALRGSGSGPLAGLTMAVKDIYDIAGHRTGFGNPDWLRTHPPATETAAAVQQLLDAGADMVGRTLTDELAYSLSGENIHYGTPVNTACPDRVSGGSSSGSAAAVAAGLVDFALGTDCGGRRACRRATAASSASGRRTGACRLRASRRSPRASTWQDGLPATLMSFDASGVCSWRIAGNRPGHSGS